MMKARVFTENELTKMNNMVGRIGYHVRFLNGSITTDTETGKKIACFGIIKPDVSDTNLKKLAKIVKKVCIEEGENVEEIHHYGIVVG